MGKQTLEGWQGGCTAVLWRACVLRGGGGDAAQGADNIFKDVAYVAYCVPTSGSELDCVGDLFNVCCYLGGCKGDSGFCFESRQHGKTYGPTETERWLTRLAFWDGGTDVHRSGGGSPADWAPGQNVNSGAIPCLCGPGWEWCKPWMHRLLHLSCRLPSPTTGFPWCGH
jgi:hypothetical protein